jgi:hypothetical protein
VLKLAIFSFDSFAVFLNEFDIDRKGMKMIFVSRKPLYIGMWLCNVCSKTVEYFSLSVLGRLCTAGGAKKDVKRIIKMVTDETIFEKPTGLESFRTEEAAHQVPTFKYI